FDSSIQWDIRSLGGAGFMAGGLFNLFLQGHGMVAVTSDGPPMLLDCSQQPTYVDPQAAVCWSANLQPQIKNDFKMGSLIGRSSGGSFQRGFHGPGFAVVQPSEGMPAASGSCAPRGRSRVYDEALTSTPPQALVDEFAALGP